MWFLDCIVKCLGRSDRLRVQSACRFTMQVMTHTARLPPPSHLFSGWIYLFIFFAALQHSTRLTEALMSTYNGKCHLCNTVNSNYFCDSEQGKVSAHQRQFFTPVWKPKLELEWVHFTSHTLAHDENIKLSWTVGKQEYCLELLLTCFSGFTVSQLDICMSTDSSVEGQI